MSDSYIALVEKSIDERTQQYQELLQLRAERENLQKELFNYKHHSEQRLIALREAESELREERETVANLRADLAAVTAERDRMREALRDCVAALKHPIRRINNDGLLLHDIKFEVGRDMAVNAALHRARAALEGVTEPVTGDSNA